MKKMNSKITEDLYRVVCRPALPKDTQQVMDLTRLIWEGDDYVPYVWEEWLSDYNGMLVVAEYGGRVVGLGKLSELAAGQWWLEGLRVHPDFQRRGIGSHIHNYLLEQWLINGDGVIRLTTGSTRLAVHHISERSGFKKIGEFTPFKAAVMDESSNDFILLRLDEVSQAVDFAINSESLEKSKGLMDLGWRWLVMNTQTLSEATEQQRAWWWREGEGLLAIWEQDWEEETSAVLMFAACKLKRITEMLVDFRKLAASMGHDWAAWFAPPQGDLVPLIEEADYKRDWEDAVYVFEREHP